MADIGVHEKNINFLHFEACYYQGIELAIKRECLTFDPGIQGHHKLKRGFEPVINTSYHWIAEKAFRDAIGDFLYQRSPTYSLIF